MGKMNNRFSEPLVYAAWTKDDDIRYSSTSGGIFSELAKVVLSHGGVVSGAQYNEWNMVEHVLIDNQKDLWRIRQSKYISSDLKDIFIQIKRTIEEGRTVAFCGSPCQVAGLYSYLGHEPDNLITIDFICRGMNSPKALKSWLDEIEREENAKVSRVWFKYKDGGWKTSPRRVRLDFENGRYVIKEGKDNLFMEGYLSSNLYIRPCCGKCHFKGIPRLSDITLADFWGIEKELDDDRGTSLVIVNSDKGIVLFDAIKDNIEFYKKNYNGVFTGNPMFTSSVEIPKKAHDFLISLDRIPFSEAIKKYSTNSHSFVNRIKRKIKRKLMGN